MKKLGIALLSVVFALFLPVSLTKAAPDHAIDQAVPVYDASFDNNKGAFFANGTPIIIEAFGVQTRINWDGGSVIVLDTVKVFGGGVADTTYKSSSIVMVGGVVKNIFGGGLSTDETKPANVTDSNVKIVNGTVTASVYGGGLLYSQVENAVVEIENGTVQSVLGGGAASTTIGGVSYNSGTQEHPELSGTVVDDTHVTVKGGIIYSLWGGGQGYSYTKESTVTVLGGTIDYVTAGGSNGQTDSVTMDIRGGMISVYQAVNRGLVKIVDTVVTGGSINTFYVGGEVASDVTGTINETEVRILGGSVETLYAGTSNSLPIELTQPNYNAYLVTGIVVNNEIPEGTISFTYVLNFEKDIFKIPKMTPKNLKVNVTTNPVGYENLISKDLLVFTSSDDTIAMINQEGTVIGIKDGIVDINASLFNQTAATSVEVDGIPINYVLQAIFAVILGIIFIALLAVFIILKVIFGFIFGNGLTR